MLESLLHHKKEVKQYLVGLVVTDERIDGSLYETTIGGQGKILKTEIVPYKGDWENAIKAADKVVSTLESELPKGAELKNVILGLFPSWLDGEKIKETHLKNLKKLSSDLALTALGFVELPTAVAHLLQKDEGTAQTVILAGVESLALTVSIFKIGKLVGNVTLKRTDSITADLEHALATFSDVEVLPSRILLYGSIADLEKVKTELLDYPWQKKANFLHLPKIEILPEDFAARAVAIGSASEIALAPVTVEEKIAATSAVGTDADKLGEENDLQSPSSDEVTAIAKDLGFEEEGEQLSEKKVLTQKTEDLEEEIALSDVGEEEVENVRPVKYRSRMLLPKLKMPQFTFSFKIPHFNRWGIFGILGTLFLLLVGGYHASFNLWRTATVKVLVSPQKFEREIDITVDTSATMVDTEKQILPAKEITSEVSGTFTVATTGSKTIGDKAKGEITIYNKTLNTKNFKAGQILSSGNLKFTLDSDVTVSSASEGIGSLTYGTNKAQITAVAIGESSNLGPGSEFSFVDLPTSSYSARNEKALSGGSSKEVNVVGRQDQQAARDKAKSELRTRAEAELAAKISADERILENASTLKIIEENFSQEVGAEADELGLEMNLAVTALVYNNKDMTALIDEVIKANLPQNYEYKGDAKITVGEVIEREEGQLFKYKVVANLLPRLDVGGVVNEIKGKSVADATEIFKRKNNVSGVQIYIKTPFAFLKNTLPRNPAKIQIEIEAL